MESCHGNFQDLLTGPALLPSGYDWLIKLIGVTEKSVDNELVRYIDTKCMHRQI